MDVIGRVEFELRKFEDSADCASDLRAVVAVDVLQVPRQSPRSRYARVTWIVARAIALTNRSAAWAGPRARVTSRRRRTLVSIPIMSKDSRDRTALNGLFISSRVALRFGGGRIPGSEKCRDWPAQAHRAVGLDDEPDPIPGLRSSFGRTSFGTVICPLLVIVASLMAPYRFRGFLTSCKKLLQGGRTGVRDIAVVAEPQRLIARIHRILWSALFLTGHAPSGLISGSLQAGAPPAPTVAR